MPRVIVHSLAQKLSAMAFTPPCMLGTDLTVATSSHSALSSGLVAAEQLAGGGCSWQVPFIRDDWHTPFACKRGTRPVSSIETPCDSQLPAVQCTSNIAAVAQGCMLSMM